MRTHFLRMVSAESVLLGILRDPWCTVWSARVLTMYHAILSRRLSIVTLGRDHNIACTVSYVMEVGAGAAFECEMVGNYIRHARHAKSQYWSSVEPILLNRSIESALSLCQQTFRIYIGDCIIEFAGGENSS
jgi:hypothetical protein